MGFSFCFDLVSGILFSKMATVCAHVCVICQDKMRQEAMCFAKLFSTNLVDSWAPRSKDSLSFSP